MQQRQLLSAEFVAANLPVLMELGKKEFNLVAYHLAVGALFDCTNNLNLGFPGRSSNPPLLYYFSLTEQGRYVIFSQPGLYSAISDETLNYRHEDGTSIIGNFCVEKAAKFFEHEDICKRIDPLLLRENRAKILDNCRSLFYKNSPLFEAIDAKSFFATLTINDLYYMVTAIGRRDDHSMYYLLKDYRELRDALYRSSGKKGEEYCNVHRLCEHSSWVKELLDNDIRIQKELEALKEKELQASKPPEPGLIDKIGKFFGSKPPNTENARLLQPINEMK